MAVTFDVTIEDLESTSNQLEEEAKEFVSYYEAIYAAVEDLLVTYKGEASETFNQRIQGYKNDFQAAKTAIEAFAAFLKEYAQELRTKEDDLKNRASALSVGK